MASKKKDKNLTFEVAGIILIGFCVFLTCCLVTYHPDDPSFATGYSSIPENINNWGGLLGSYMSSWFFQVLGVGAYIMSVSIFLISLKLLFRPQFPYSFYIRMFFYVLLFLCAEAFMSLYIGELNFYRYNFDAGGVLGLALSLVLIRYLSAFGTYLLLILIFLLIIMGLTKVSYVRLWNQFSSMLRKRVQAPVANVVSNFISHFNRWKLRLSFEKKKRITQQSPGSSVKKENEGQVDILDFEDGAEHRVSNYDIPINITGEKASRKLLSDKDLEFEPFPEQTSMEYALPPLTLLDTPGEKDIEIDTDSLREDAEVLTQKLSDFDVTGSVVEINPGPVITRFEFEPAPGIKLNKIVSLSDDLALALKAMSVRIAPIAGKSVVGIEIPNKKRKKVFFKEIISQDEFLNSKSKLTIGLGKDIAGSTVINDLSHMPHLLVAGATGSGKSIFVNSVICSIIFKATPDEVKFLMIDPKRLELSPYEGIPHLLHPVVIDPKKAAFALRWAVNEMERRYEKIAEKGARNIVQYNKKIEEEMKSGDKLPDGHEKMTYIVVVIDELADLMMVAARDVEGYIARLAQMARASGIHLLVATQRPSVDIITGIIKANFPSRISFQVSSKVDSRTILDRVGAEKLLGMGDMFFMPPGTSRLQRIHGAHISEKEVNRIAKFVKEQGRPSYDESILAIKEEEDASGDEDEKYDELYDKAVALVAETRQASISMLQRKMRVGYNRAARMIERMEKEGVVGPSDGVKPRDVLVNRL
jgi:S-DNA-T family DNA segregation ATPase FtsK/SpoIIIE